MEPLIGFVVFVVILAIVVWALVYILGLLPVPEPFNRIAMVVIMLVALLVLLNRALPLLHV
jgi:hypothetical protein